MIFEPVTPQNAEKLRPYYINCNYRLCEYSVGVKLMWGSVLHPAFCEAANCLIVRNQIDGRYQFDFPVPGPEGDVGRGSDPHREILHGAGGAPGGLRGAGGGGRTAVSALPGSAAH